MDLNREKFFPPLSFASANAAQQEDQNSLDNTKKSSPLPAQLDRSITGYIDHEALPEISGLATSQIYSGHLWTHNDGGNKPYLFLISADGKLKHQVYLKSLHNRDWEDMSSFMLEDQPWLMVADVGDNKSKRPEVDLHFVQEPKGLLSGQQNKESSSVSSSELSPDLRLIVKFEDGARDCEAVAVDVAGQRVYFLTKRESQPRLYSAELPELVPNTLENIPYKRVTARFEAALSSTKPRFLNPFVRLLLGQIAKMPTAMDISGDNAVILTYSSLLRFKRLAGQSWGQAMQLTPISYSIKELGQAEAVSFNKNGTAFYATSEGGRAPLIRWQSPNAVE